MRGRTLMVLMLMLAVDQFESRVAVEKASLFSSDGAAEAMANPVGQDQGKDIPTCFPGDPCGPRSIS